MVAEFLLCELGVSPGPGIMIITIMITIITIISSISMISISSSSSSSSSVIVIIIIPGGNPVRAGTVSPPAGEGDPYSILIIPT